MLSSANDLDSSNTQTESKMTSPAHSSRSQSSSPSNSTLLVIDDTPDAEEPLVTKPIPSTATKPQPSNPPPAPPLHMPTHTAPARCGSISNTIDQQRRRNSSIAKLLGGQPLHNQQYEEINQQILDDQSAQNTNHNHESGSDSTMQRTRSSITRTLLMKSDRTSHATKPPPAGVAAAKDFEYLIHSELDNEHGPAVNPKTNSVSKTYPNALNPASDPLGQSSTQMKLKRKRQISKTSSNSAPFALHDPFQLQSSSSSPESAPSMSPAQKKYVHFESLKRPCYASTPPSQHSYHLPASNSLSPASHSTYSYPPPVHRTSSPYNPFTIHEERRSPTTGASSFNRTGVSNCREVKLPSDDMSIASARKSQVNICKESEASGCEKTDLETK